MGEQILSCEMSSVTYFGELQLPLPVMSLNATINSTVKLHLQVCANRLRFSVIY